jgi:glutamyl-tRNA reductase
MQVTEKTCQKTRVGEVRQEAKLRYESRRAQARKLWRLVEVETASKIMLLSQSETCSPILRLREVVKERHNVRQQTLLKATNQKAGEARCIVDEWMRIVLLDA